MYLLAILMLVAIGHSYAGFKETIGVLVLAHGGSAAWNQHVEDAVAPIRSEYPVEVAYGMALPRTIQEGIDKLEKKGVTKIVVVPLFISSHSFIIRQTEYLLKKRDELADPPMVMDHSAGHGAGAHGTNGHGAGHHGPQMSEDGSKHAEKETLEQLRFNAEIILTGALDDHPIVADILYSRIMELSHMPANEAVIIVGHGPNPEDDNRKWVEEMESLADQIRAKQKGENKASRLIFTTTVRDDADKAIYEQAKENLRNLVKQAGKHGDVLVVPLLLSQGGVEKGIVKRLEGLEYHWSGKTLLPDPKITEFVKVSVEEALEK